MSSCETKLPSFPDALVLYFFLVSVLFIAVPTNAENSYISLCTFYIMMHNKKHAVYILHRQDNMVCWLGFISYVQSWDVPPQKVGDY